MANPAVKAGVKLLVKGGKALKNRLNKPKTIKPGKTSKVKKYGDMVKTGLQYVAAESVISAGYNKFKNRNKNQSVNSTDNMSTSGPIDRSIEKNR
jgi:hypothetical protein